MSLIVINDIVWWRRLMFCIGITDAIYARITYYCWGHPHGDISSKFSAGSVSTYIESWFSISFTFKPPPVSQLFSSFLLLSVFLGILLSYLPIILFSTSLSLVLVSLLLLQTPLSLASPPNVITDIVLVTLLYGWLFFFFLSLIGKDKRVVMDAYFSAILFGDAIDTLWSSSEMLFRVWLRRVSCWLDVVLPPKYCDEVASWASIVMISSGAGWDREEWLADPLLYKPDGEISLSLRNWFRRVPLVLLLF